MAGAWNIRRFQVSASVAPLFMALVVAIVAVVVAWPGSAGYKDMNPLYETSKYPEIADEVARLNIAPWNHDDRKCRPHRYAFFPCFEMFPLWEAFIARHELPENRESADMFEAYIDRDYRLGDRLYAEAKGYELPPYGGYEGPGTELADLQLQQDKRCPACQEKCSLNPYSDYPCMHVISIWRDFAEKYGLPLDRKSGEIFEAYAEHDFKRGDRLYTSTTGRSTMLGDEEPHSQIGDEANQFGYGGIDRRCPACQEKCTYNYFADYPCVWAIQPWRDFAAKHGLPLDETSADIFQAYVERRFVEGDKLFAAEKGMTVEELLESTGITRSKPKEPGRLLIDIYPMHR